MKEALKFIYLHPLGRKLTHRFGPAVWRLPATLRRRMCFESQVPRLPGVRVWSYGEPETVRPVPAWRAGEAPTFGHRLAARPYRLDRPWIAELPRAWVVGRHACVVSPKGHVLLTAFRDQPRVLGLERNDDLLGWLGNRGWQRPFESQSAGLFPMVNRLDSNYFHWIIECCGQLEGLEEYERATACRPNIMIRKDGAAFHRPTLELLGIHGDRIVEWDQSLDPIAAERVIVASIPGNRVACSPRSLAWLRHRILKKVGVEESAIHPHRRLYISRKPGSWRSVVNEEEVVAALAKEGFEIVRAEQLGFRDQVRLFAEANTVLAIHGSGLTNALFAPRSATVVEMFGSYGDGVFFSIAAAMGQKYLPFRCKPVNDNIIVDVPALLRFLGSKDRALEGAA